MNNIYVICAAALVLLACLMEARQRTLKKEHRDTATEKEPVDDPAVCCGKHAVCEKQRLADAMGHKAQYFEDEELDRFAERSSDAYSDSEVEEFRYVMYTMKPEEVLEWLESLKVRGIELPDALKDEACLLIS